ncbi:hypothetical protein ACU5B6_04780 [Moritella viscosa]|uniref:hypothetical protein n=2 Tax=Moritella viscosa TaxID=80854 RepID=UPI000910F4C5|nr:hypothetical protein [Moritella viscosa]SHO02313.1 Predicted protein [Moritella viscosa]
MAIRAANVHVDLTANSSQFSQALDRLQRNAQTSSNGVIRSLGRMEQTSQRFEQRMTQALNAPFRAFRRQMAPFIIATRQIGNILRNVTRPFINLARTISGPFVTAFKKAAKAMRSFSGILRKIGGGVAGVTAIFVGLTVASSKASLEILSWSKVLGVSYRELNELTYAASVNGIEMDTLADSMKDLSAKITDVTKTDGGALKDFFTQINQKASDWNKLSPADQLVAFSEELSKMNSSEQLFWADEVNGAMAEMVPLLSKGKEYFEDMREESEMFGSGIGGVEQIKEITSVLARMKYGLRNFFTGVGANIAPAILDAFDNAMASFKTKLEAMGGGDAGLGFEKWVNDFSVSVIDGMISMIQNVDIVIASIKTAFDSVTNVLNNLKDLPFMNGKKSLTASAQFGGNAGEITKADNTYKRAKTFERRRDEEQATLDTMNNGWGASVEEKRDYQRQEAKVKAQEYQLRREAAKSGVVSRDVSGNNLSDQLLVKLNDKIDRANNIAAEKTTSTKPNSYVTALENTKTSIKTRNISNKELTPEELKVQAERLAYTQKITDAADELSKALGDNYKGSIVALDEFKAASLKYSDIAKQSSEEVVNVNTWEQEQIKLINAGSDYDIATARHVSKHESIEANRALALEGIKLEAADKRSVIAEEDAKDKADAATKKAEKLKLITDSSKAIRDIKVQFGLIAADDLDTLNRNEVASLTEAYDNKIALLMSAHTVELDLVKELKEAKIQALDELRAKQDEDAELDLYSNQGTIESFAALTSEKENIIGNHSSVVQGYSNKELSTAMKTEDGKMKLAMAGGSQLLAEAAKTNKKAFQLQKAMNIANAVMNTAQGATRALAEGGPYMGPALAAMTVALGAIQISTISQQQWSGQAHDGIDNVPNTGTWNLEKGERVTDKRTNADLKQYLAENNGKGSNGDVSVQAPVTIHSAQMSNSELMDVLREQPNEMRKLLRDVM